MSPYRIHLEPTEDDSERWLRLDQALEIALKNPSLAYWMAFDVWLDSIPKVVDGRFMGGNPEIVVAAANLLHCVAPPVDETSLRMIGAAFRSRS